MAEEFKAKYDTLAQVWYDVLEIMHEAGNDLRQGNARYSAQNALLPHQNYDGHLRHFSSQYWGAFARMGDACAGAFVSLDALPLNPQVPLTGSCAHTTQS